MRLRGKGNKKQKQTQAAISEERVRCVPECLTFDVGAAVTAGCGGGVKCARAQLRTNDCDSRDRVVCRIRARRALLVYTIGAANADNCDSILRPRRVRVSNLVHEHCLLDARFRRIGHIVLNRR